MDGTLTAGGEPVGLGPYGTLLAILKLKDVSDLEFVSVKDIEKALPDDATLQHKVDCLRLLKQAKEARHRPSSVYSSESTTPSILASATTTSTSEDAKSLAGVLRLQPPDGKVWQGTSDKRPATAFLYRVAESARLAALSEMDTWRYLTAVCLQQSQARELDNYLSKNIAPDATILDRLQSAELWFNNRWSITNNVDKIYVQLRDINHISFINVEALHDIIVNLQQHARYLNHEIPLTALRRAFLDGLPNWLRQPLLQVHPQATTPLHVMVDWCTSYEESSGRKLTSQSVPAEHSPTMVCRLNLQGRCTYGTRCKFLHTTSSAATPTPLAGFPTAPPQQGHDEVNLPLQAAVIPSTVQPIAGKRQRQVSPTDADPVVKKICTRPYQAQLYLTRKALGQPCRERDELLLKGIIVQDPTGLARLAGTQRLYVPLPLQPLLLQRYHDYYAHPGKKALYDLASRHWWFPRMSKVCSKYPYLSCILCKSYHNRKPFEHLLQPHKPLSHLAIDFTGPYANTKHPYAVTISDMYTCLQIYPTKHPTTNSICKVHEGYHMANILNY